LREVKRAARLRLHAGRAYRIEPTMSSEPLSDGAVRRLARLQGPRLSRELRTMQVMLSIWCRDQHASTGGDLCPECSAFMDYATRRLAACPYGEDKPTCANCQIHCYGPAQREQARVMMRYAGPRMLSRHPILAIRHILDGKRPAPAKPRNPRAAGDAPES
jgi:hypothetical protein